MAGAVQEDVLENLGGEIVKFTKEGVRKLREESIQALIDCKDTVKNQHEVEEKTEMMVLIKKLFFLEKDDHDYDLTLKQILEYLVRNT